MSGIVGPPIRTKEEGCDGRISDVVECSDVEFKEVEKADGRDEEWHSPEWDGEIY